MRQRCLKYLGFLALLGLTVPAYAQQWTGGLKLGAAVSTFVGDAPSNLDPRVGWAGGIALGFDFGTGLAIQSEALYVVKGAYFDGTVDGTPVRAHSTISYAQVPLLVTYRLQRGTVYPKVFAGPMVARRLDATLNFRAKAGGPSFTQVDDSIHRLEYGGIIGAGVEKDISGQRLSLEVRGVFGRADLHEEGTERHNRSLEVLVGLLF